MSAIMTIETCVVLPVLIAVNSKYIMCSFLPLGNPILHSYSRKSNSKGTIHDWMNDQKAQNDIKPDNNIVPVQQTWERTRPAIGNGSVEELVYKTYGLTVTQIKELNSYDGRNYFIQVDIRHGNSNIIQLHPDGYVLKIYNSKESQDPESFDAEHAVMTFFTQNGMPIQNLVPNLAGRYHSLETIYPDGDRKGTPGKYIVDLRTFIPGRMLKDVPYTIDLLVQVGRLIANVKHIFKGYDDFYYKTGDPSKRLCSITNVPVLRKYTFCLGNDDRTIIEDIISTFNRRVVSQCDNLPKGYIHGDLNDRNLLVSKSPTGDAYDICGILDFTVEYTYPVLDLALNIAYMMLDSHVVDKLDAPGYILAGYCSIETLTPEEWDVLVPCVAGRLAQSFTLGAHAHFRDPSNSYVLTTSRKGWPVLRRLWATPETSLVSKWKDIINSFQ